MNFRLALIIIIVFGMAGCSHKNFACNSAYNFKSQDKAPDYANLNYWAAHPWKWDPSDSIPKPLRSTYQKDSLADVFFLYPTTFTSTNDTNWNASIDDRQINAKTDYSAILFQASAFSEKTRVFAPRYRQANLQAYFTKDTIAALKAFDLAYEDIKAAFTYYLSHYNKGRPVIIASHSQGTNHAQRLLKEFFEGKKLFGQLLCAYLAGMPTADTFFTKIPSCKDSVETGCYVSWRTFKSGYEGTGYIINEDFKSTVTNPLLWNTSTDYAPAYLNKGGVLKNFNTVIPGVVDAQVHKNILWTQRPKFFGNIFLKTKNYHIADINFFYVNIKDNVNTRINSFYKNKR